MSEPCNTTATCACDGSAVGEKRMYPPNRSNKMNPTTTNTRRLAATEPGHDCRFTGFESKSMSLCEVENECIACLDVIMFQPRGRGVQTSTRIQCAYCAAT